MEKKHKHQKRGKTHIPAADSFTNYDHAGWMSRLYHDGWLKKRWRKRYCVLSNGTLYLYEKQTAKGSESSSAAIDLSKFSSCVKATGKEAKKSPNTIVLEPTAANNGNEEKEQNNNNGTKAKLEHVTKSRARPPRGGGGNRRPPTKQHIKERARMSEIAMDEEDEQPRKSARESRGHIPVIAIKPTGKPILPNSSLTIGKKVDATVVKDSDATVNSLKSSEQDELNSANTKSPPKLPPAALKPKSKPTDDALMSISEKSNVSSEHSEENVIGSGGKDASVEQSTGDNSDLNDETMKSPPKLPPAALKPKSKPTSKPTDDSLMSKPKESDLGNEHSEGILKGSGSMDASAELSTGDNSKLFNETTRSPPKLPPAAMKPKFKQTEVVENGEESDFGDDGVSKFSTTDSSEPLQDAPAPASASESSPTQKKPPALPHGALKPKMTPEKSKAPTNEQLRAEDSHNPNCDETAAISGSVRDIGDDGAHGEVIADNFKSKSDRSTRKSLTNLKLSYEHQNAPRENRSNSF